MRNTLGRVEGIHVAGILETLLVAAVIGLIPATIAQNKGHDFATWWFYGFAIFIVAFPHSLLLRPNQRALEAKSLAEGGKRCPYCAEVIKREALVCRYCGRDLTAPQGTSAGETDVVREALTDLRWQYQAWAASTVDGPAVAADSACADLLASFDRLADLAAQLDSNERWRLAKQIRTELPKVDGDDELRASVARVEG